MQYFTIYTNSLSIAINFLEGRRLKKPSVLEYVLDLAKNFKVYFIVDPFCDELRLKRAHFLILLQVIYSLV